MSEPTPPPGEGPGERAPRSAGAAAFLPIGVVFLVIGLTQLRDGAGAAFLVLGIVFLGMSVGGGYAATRRAAGRDEDPGPSGP